MTATHTMYNPKPKEYLINMVPFAGTILSNIKDQIKFDELSEVLDWVAHFSPYIEMLEVYEVNYGRYNPNKCLLTVDNTVC